MTLVQSPINEPERGIPQLVGVNGEGRRPTLPKPGKRSPDWTINAILSLTDTSIHSKLLARPLTSVSLGSDGRQR